MEKQVNLEFSGVSNVNPDNISKNGEVAMGFGLTSQSTISTPTSPKKVHLYHIDNCDVVCIHKGSGFENVFVYDKEGDQVRAYPYDELANEDGEPTAIASVDGKPTSACMLGNVVVLTFSDKQKYFYREGDEYTYERDSNLPTFHMKIVAAVRRAFYSINGDSYGTDGPDDTAISNHIEAGDHFTDYKQAPDPTSEECGIYETTHLPSYSGGPTTTANKQQNAYMGAFNAMVDFWNKKGYLMSPVLVRACYRLKSGGISSLTPPVLCMPFEYPFMASGYYRIGWQNDYYVRMRGIAYKLYAKFLGIEDDDFTKFGDVIDSVEIYMSLPIYTYYTDARYIKKAGGESAKINEFGRVFFCPYKERRDSEYPVVAPTAIETPLSIDKLADISNFYLVCSIPFKKSELVELTADEDSDYYKSEIYDTYTDGALRGYRKLVKKGLSVTSESLATQHAMEDVLYSGSGFVYYPLRSVVYNQRLLNLGQTLSTKNDEQVDVSVFSGMVRMKSSCSFNTISVGNTYSPTVQYDITNVPSVPVRYTMTSINKLGPYLNLGYGVIKDTEGNNASIAIRLGAMYSIPMYFAFLQVNLKYILAQGSALNGARPNGKYVKIYFEEHPTLNLAYFKGEVGEYTNESGDYAAVKAEYAALEKAVAEGTATYTTDNYIRASNVGDPYTFEDSNTAYFNSTVKEVMVVPEAISLGQYGTAQLYVLCEDGIYTVAVNDEGKLQSVTTYSQERPVHPERSCVFKTQLVTNNGREWGAYSGQRKEDLLSLMRNLAFAFDELPHISDKIVSGDYSTLVQGTTLYDFLCNASLAYDGHNDQLVAYAEGYPCIAVWKQGHGLHILPIPATRKVEAARLVLADAEQNIYEFAEADILEDTEGLLVSRPIHLADDINTPCTVRKLIVRGDFDYQRTQIKLVLYGTRDFRKWHLVASSATYYLTGISGSGYKAFKVAVIAKLGRHEYISHLTIRYVEKPTKNLSF